jgi:hypothetical protein
MSGYLLSLENRDNLTVQIIEQIAARSRINVLSEILWNDDTRYELKLHTTALVKHWSSIESSISEATPEQMLAD